MEGVEGGAGNNTLDSYIVITDPEGGGPFGIRLRGGFGLECCGVL